ncbi:MAG TPA: acyltransferase [Bryobacteraceae bacterium]|nr:acyltransferase [Bryobacteraceae bacterium]
MNSPAQSTFHERYIPALDGIRGVAIIAVLLHHCRFLLNPAFPVERALVKTMELGWCGVVLFFVLSGFLITGILLDTQTSPNFFSTFYARRFLRIFPLYYVSLAMAFFGSRVLHSLLGAADPLAHVSPWWYLGYVQNFRPASALMDPYLGPMWSLAVEEQFYLVWPLLVLLLNRRALTWLCAALIPFSFAVRFHYTGTPAGDLFVNTFTLASLDALAAGALLAIAIRNPAWRRRMAFLARPIAVAGLASFGLLAWRAGSLFEYAPGIQTWGITALVVSFAMITFVAATSKRGVTVGILQLSGLRFTGKISYGLYVLHPLVMALAIPALGAVPATAAVDLALNADKIVLVLLACFAAAAASWFYFEKPILGLKKHFRYSEPAPLRRSAAAD